MILNLLACRELLVAIWVLRIVSHVLQLCLVLLRMDRWHNIRVRQDCWRATLLYPISIGRLDLVLFDSLICSLYLFSVVLLIIKMLVNFVCSFNCGKLDSTMRVSTLADKVEAYNLLFCNNIIEFLRYLALRAPSNIGQNDHLIVLDRSLLNNFSTSKVLGCGL